MQSLYLVELNDCTLLRTDKGQTRLTFEYRAMRYNLSVTDPATTRLQRGASKYIEHVTACVSLAPPFKGHHYKLIATLFT